MDGNNRKEGQAPMGQPQGGAVEQSASSGAPPMDPNDWKAQLTLDSRHRIVNKIAETLKKHIPFSGQEGLEVIKRIALRFEEKIYSGATSQSDYLRKISLKMLNMEINSQSPTTNSLQTNADYVSRNSSDLGKGRIQSESAIGFMDGNNLRGGQVPMGQPQSGAVEQSTLSSSGSSPPMYPDDWRAQLPLDSRHKIVNNTKDTLKKGLPFSGQEQEGLQEIKKIVGGFEERIHKIYSAATSQSDYLREISPKMLIMDTNSASPTPNSLQTNAANASRNSSGLGINI